MRGESKELNDFARNSAGGSFIQLPDGITHYELSPPLYKGEGKGVRDVVLIHGFSVPYFIYDPTFEFLADSGFRVLRYDLFGRGFSDRPRTQYDLDFFVKQLVDLLDAIRFKQRLSLVGLSMGGPIASAFALRHPKRADKIILIDPVGAKPLNLSPFLKAAKIPFAAELVLNLVGSDSLVRGVASDFFDPSLVEHFIARYKIQMEYKGFRGAILSTIRNNMLGSFINVYENLGRTNNPVQIFWGRNDSTVPFDHCEILRVVMPNAQFHVIENCGHIPHYEKPGEFNPILLDFLRQSS
ncbi:MAG TPA: alpha/beta hydrolase [Anaerolineales bacterium]|nr:alpha/beta hydrolase [Anaerolineales bacterium]